MANGDLFGLMDAPVPATNQLFALMVYPTHEAALAAQDRGRTYQSDLRLGRQRVSRWTACTSRWASSR
jgi:hypothetical protein